MATTIIMKTPDSRSESNTGCGRRLIRAGRIDELDDRFDDRFWFLKSRSSTVGTRRGVTRSDVVPIRRGRPARSAAAVQPAVAWTSHSYGSRRRPNERERHGGARLEYAEGRRAHQAGPAEALVIALEAPHRPDWRRNGTNPGGAAQTFARSLLSFRTSRARRENQFILGR